MTQEGKRLRVVYPGRPNARAGPDFHDAVFATESGGLITGDVELHLNSPDWYGHRHHRDPNYNGVVLHVVLWPRGHNESRQQSGTRAPVASLADAAPLLEDLDSEVEPRHPYLMAMDGATLGEALDRAGDERFMGRSRGFALELTDTAADQALFRSLMEALGYSSNRKPFRELAQRVPVESLTWLLQEPAATRLVALRAVLVGTAGLLCQVKPAGEAQELSRLHRLLARRATALTQNKEGNPLRPMAASQWRLFRVRPANHPVARITGAAYLLERFLGTGLARGLEQAVLSGDARSLIEKLSVRPFIGRSRAADIAVNVVLPFQHAYATLQRSTGLNDRCVQLYREFPRLEDNEVIREMKRLLGAETSASLVTGARRQQGLIHLYKRMWTTGISGGPTLRRG